MGTHPIFESDFDCLTEKSMFANKTVAELKTECKSRGIPVTGKKQELIDRLMAAENDKSMEDDLLDEPDVSLGEEVGQETAEETVTEPASENAADETEETAAPVAAVADDVDEMEKKKLERAKKFGIEDAPQLADVKKKSRAERFGLVNEPVQNGKNGASENSEESEELDSKKKSRAERFGLNINQKRKAKLEGMDVGIDAEKLKKRSERFGNAAVQAAKTGNGEIDEKKAARAARFAKA